MNGSGRRTEVKIEGVGRHAFGAKNMGYKQLKELSVWDELLRVGRRKTPEKFVGEGGKVFLLTTKVFTHNYTNNEWTRLR